MKHQSKALPTFQLQTKILTTEKNEWDSLLFVWMALFIAYFRPPLNYRPYGLIKLLHEKQNQFQAPLIYCLFLLSFF